MAQTIMNRRRALMMAGVAGIAGVSMGNLSSCSPSTVLPAVIDSIISVMAPACQVIPAIATLVDVVAAAFPAAVGVATITDAVAKQIAQYLCALFTNNGVVPGQKPASSKLTATVNNKTVELHGWTFVNGKIVQF